MAIHAARIEQSDRLRRALSVLSDGHWHSTREIMRIADVCAVNTVISELRSNGIDIETRCVGQGRYEYRRVMAEQGSLF
jgi:biotin operon repressor